MGRPTDSIVLGQDRCDDLASARRVLLDALDVARDRPILVAIGGRVGSGKSTLANQLEGSVLSTDEYLPDYDKVPELERDEPRHAELDLLEQNLRELMRGESTNVPIWSFEHHRGVGSRVFEPAPLLIIEGIHALHARVRAMAHIQVLVEASREVRWNRWAQIERDGERGWGVERARWHFENVAEPVFDRFESEYQASADLRVRNED